MEKSKSLESRLILALDAALGPAGVAVLRGSEILAFSREDRPQMQAKRLVLMVEEALQAAKTPYEALDAIVSTVGPGTFTGLRIGLAAARGLGFALQKPVHGISSLAACAYAAHREKPGESRILAALNAGKGECYYQLFSTAPFAPLSTPGIGAPAQALACAGGAMLAGNAPAEWFPACEMISLPPDAATAGRLATAAPHLLLPPEPLYIRPPDAKVQAVTPPAPG